MGLRPKPENRQPFHCSVRFIMRTTSAESNAASVSAYLGLPVKILTAFIKGCPMSRFMQNNLGHRGMDYEGTEFLTTILSHVDHTAQPIKLGHNVDAAMLDRLENLYIQEIRGAENAAYFQ